MQQMVMNALYCAYTVGYDVGRDTPYSSSVSIPTSSCEEGHHCQIKLDNKLTKNSFFDFGYPSNIVLTIFIACDGEKTKI